MHPHQNSPQNNPNRRSHPYSNPQHRSSSNQQNPATHPQNSPPVHFFNAPSTSSSFPSTSTQMLRAKNTPLQNQLAQLVRKNLPPQQTPPQKKILPREENPPRMVYPFTQYSCQYYYCKSYSAIAIFDTCSLLLDVDLLSNAVCNKVLCVIPYMVLHELDFLKMRHDLRSSVMKTSRLIEHLHSTSPHFIRLEASFEAEVKVPGFVPDLSINDDKILRSALRVKSEVRTLLNQFPVAIAEHQVVFVTDDKTLTTKAIAHRMAVADVQKFVINFTKKRAPRIPDDFRKSTMSEVRDLRALADKKAKSAMDAEPEIVVLKEIKKEEEPEVVVLDSDSEDEDKKGIVKATQKTNENSDWTTQNLTSSEFFEKSGLKNFADHYDPAEDEAEKKRREEEQAVRARQEQIAAEELKKWFISMNLPKYPARPATTEAPRPRPSIPVIPDDEVLPSYEEVMEGMDTE